jgi:hypothetical protein
MLALARWLSLVALFGLLAGLSVTYRWNGQTAAERVCRLSRSSRCLQLAVRWDEKARQLVSLLRLEPAAPPKRPEPRPVSHITHLAVTEPATAHQAPPLDRHTPAERQALDKIVAQRASH